MTRRLLIHTAAKGLEGVRFLSVMTEDKIRQHVHRDGTDLPSVRPCDTANGSDTKVAFSAEDLYRTHGCRPFCNYKHLIMTSKDGQWLEGGEFPLPLGSNASLRKSNRGKPIDRTLSKFCDVVHLNIAFGDCVSIGGFRYALVFVDRATRYNWIFGLRSLSSDCIKSAFLKFRSAAGRYATQF